MKQIKKAINFIYFMSVVIAFAVGTVYVIAFTGNGLINGFKSLSPDDWFYGLIMLFLIIPRLRDIGRLYKPIFEPEGYDNF